MKRLFLLFLIIPQMAFSQYNAKSFCLEASDEVVSKPIQMSFSKDHEFNLDINSAVSGFSITGKATLENNNDSYIRVLLKDDYNYDHLVYENYPMLADELSMEFNNTAIETVLLDSIIPKSIRIECHHATLELNSINYVRSKPSIRMSASRVASVMKSQGQFIVEKLNSNLEKRKALWRAGVTSVSEMTYEEKKAMFGGILPELYGFDYYMGGIFVIPEEEDLSNRLNRSHNRDSNDFVSEWDWRNRHGKNWMTPAKNQGSCWTCWAFAAVGVIEAYTNLFFNKALNPNLSEQEIISCTQTGCNGGYESTAFSYIRTNGIVNELCFPYQQAYINCSEKCEVPDTQIFINNYQYINLNSENSIKQALFKNPLTIAVGPWAHSMVIVGYKTIEIGDTIYMGNQQEISYEIIDSIQHQNIIGRTAWLTKNCWGPNFGDNGCSYVIVDIGNIWRVLTITGNITSPNFNSLDIVCEDADGDGYYFWGVGPKPSNCPSWAPDIPDGDDSNINYGALDNYGHLDALPAGITIKTPVTYSSNSSTSYRLGIVNGGSLTITGTTTLTGSSKIRVCEGGILIVDGGTLQNADITMVPGSTLIVRNNGKINMATGQVFHAPRGVIVNIESGEIN